MSREYEKYTEALVKELKMYPEYEYDTVYFGGGTPSLLPIELLSYIMENIKYKKEGEITLELNPNDMSTEKLIQLRKFLKSSRYLSTPHSQSFFAQSFLSGQATI